MSLVKAGYQINCDRFFDTSLEMANKSRFWSITPQRKVSPKSCTMWEKYKPKLPTPTEAETNQDAQLALILEKEEQTGENDAFNRRSIRASSRAKSSTVCIF